MPKPRLVKVYDLDMYKWVWRCSDSTRCSAIAWANTKKEAYDRWKRHYERCARSIGA